MAKARGRREVRTLLAALLGATAMMPVGAGVARAASAETIPTSTAADVANGVAVANSGTYVSLRILAVSPGVYPTIVVPGVTTLTGTLTIAGGGTQDPNGLPGTALGGSVNFSGGLVDNGVVNFNGATRTFGSNVSGSGRIVQGFDSAGGNPLFGGTLTLSGTNSYSGGTAVIGGGNTLDASGTPAYSNLSSVDLVFANPSALPAGGTINVSYDGAVGFGWAFGQSVLNQFLVTPAPAGYIETAPYGVVALGADNSSNLDFTGKSGLALGATQGTFTYSGTLTPGDPQHEVTSAGYSTSNPSVESYYFGGGNGTLIVSSNLGDVGGPTGLISVSGYTILTGSNTYTGGTYLDYSTVVQFASPAALGPAGTNYIYVGNESVAAAGYALDQNFLNHITPDSTGTVGMTVSSANALDLSRLPGVTLGLIGDNRTAPAPNLVFSGALTPASNTFRFGGGVGTLTVAALLGDGPANGSGAGPNSLVVNQDGATSTVILDNLDPLSGAASVFGGALQLGDQVSTGNLTRTSGIALSSGAVLAFAEPAALSFGGAVSGAGGLEQDGPGTLTLTGQNSYTGPTVIAGGTLVLGPGGSIADSGSLTFTQGTASLFNPALGANGPAPMLDISGGGDQTAPEFKSTTPATINLGANTLTIGPNANPGEYSVFTGVIQGSGGIVDNGANEELEGLNTYSGGTVIDKGDVIAGNLFATAQAGGPPLLTGATGTLGSGPIVEQTYLSFFEPGDLVIPNAISGAGQMQLVSFGKLTFTNVNTTTGTVIIQDYASLAYNPPAGTPDIVVQLGDGVHNGSLGSGTIKFESGFGNGDILPTLQFDEASPISLSNTFAGAGFVVQNGPGSVTLTGSSTNPGIGTNGAELTSVNAGALYLDGAEPGMSVTVNNGGTFGGTGSTGLSVTVNSGGALAESSGQTLGAGWLSLEPGSSLDLALGAPSSTGLFNVANDVNLDGTLNVTDAGGFGPGVYRLFDYGGVLTGGGLAIGAIPDGDTGQVQTSIAAQINLVISAPEGGAPAATNFWNGATTTPAGTVVGGAGTWTAGPLTNWTDAAGAASGPWPGGFAIFQGAPGAVTVDDGAGAVNATGLQFAVDGYSINGGVLTLTGEASDVRVGDGSAAGAGYTATIAASIAGLGLVKTDLGTLVLTGANSYVGGTTIDAGVLSVSSDANLGAAGTGLSLAGGALATTASFASGRPIGISAPSSLSEAAGTTLVLSGPVTGEAALTKSGGGQLTLSGPDGLSGGVTVATGALEVDGALASPVAVQAGGVLQGAGSIAGAVSVAGVLNAAYDQTLTVGALSLAGGAAFDVALAGPSANPLIVDNGALTLGGTLNISDAGGFGVGLYRLIDYAGALTDNGLAIGQAPEGAPKSGLTVQTSIAGQVNLIYSPTGPLQFWNGSTAAPAGTVVGGSGTWTLGPSNWTNASGTATGGWTGGAAIFAGAPGTVSVDDSAGAVTVNALQFAVGGYSVTGGVLTLTGLDPTVRVGDGTGAGAGYSATIAAVLAGSGGLTKTDLGTLVLSGVNSFTGSVTVLGGTLSVGADASLGDPGNGVTLDGGELSASSSFGSARSVVFSGAGDLDTASGAVLDLTGVVSGDGAWSKTGVGELELTGVSLAAGAIDDQAGTLRVDGSIAGAVTVESGARLQGKGAVGSANVLGGGTLAPGDSIGTLTVNGPLTFQAGSIYEVELNAQGQSDLVHATGNTTILGGVVNALPAAGLYRLGTQYQIVASDGFLTGAFAGVTGSLAQPFLQLSLGYGAGGVYLDVTRNGASFCSVAATGNQCAAADAADSLNPASPVYAAVANLPDAAQARAAFEALSGEIHADLHAAALEDSRFVREAALGRLRAPDDGEAVWGQVFGARGSLDGDGDAAGVKRTVGGFFLGLDTPADQIWRLGVLGGYSRTTLDVGARSSSAYSDDYHLGAYGGVRAGPLAVRYGVAYTWRDIATDRSIAFGDFADAVRASTHDQTTQAFGELALPLGAPERRLEPFADLAYVALHSDRFSETGGAAALQGADDQAQATYATAGLRGDLQGTLGGAKVSLRASVAWRGAYGEITPAERLAFASGGQGFTVDGAPIARDAVVGGVDLGVQVGARSRLSLDYGVQAGEHAQDQSLKLALDIGF